MNLNLRTLLVAAALLAMSACGKQSSKMVYVLEEPQSVTLIASASPAKVERGEAVTLHAERRSTGKWKQVPMDQVTQGQCWVIKCRTRWKLKSPIASSGTCIPTVQWPSNPNIDWIINASSRLTVTAESH